MFYVYSVLRMLLVRWTIGLLLGTRLGTAVVGLLLGGVALLYVAHTKPELFLNMMMLSAPYLALAETLPVALP